MSFPPAFLDELRARLPLSQVVGRKVTWDRRKSNPARGDWWAPCPFHHEKTPSFHVEDNKGFFYCFGCQAKGDLISFVTETENCSFVEAVELLAREAGLEMPERRADPRAREERDRHHRLFEVMEQAVRAFQVAYRSGAGALARDYVAGRGLTDETVARFELGAAPDARHHLAGLFREKGLLDEAVTAGLLIRPEDGGQPFDRFRNRLMFPIRDARGRCIAFGARALSADQQAKYLNSPETPLFSKGRTLYNHGAAREAAGKAGGLIVAEGYMDVIALAQAGFAHAVAPLGTAVTSDQLQLLWRMADEPVIALDGDEAGLRAAEKVVRLALPLLAPGKSLRFCVLPQGQDPDDLIRAGGAPAMRRALEGARPLVEQLWLAETAARPLDTPERRAALDQQLRGALATIADASVRAHYEAEIRRRRAELFRPAAPQGAGGAAPRGFQNAGGGRSGKWSGKGGAGRRGGRFQPPEGASASARNSALARAGAAGGPEAARGREAAILMIACHNPGALGTVEAALEAMRVVTPDLGRIRDALLAALAEIGPGLPGATGAGAGSGTTTVAGTAGPAEAGPAGTALAARIAALTGEDPLAALARVPRARTHPLARPGHDPLRIAEVLDEAIRRHEAALAWEEEAAAAARDLADAEGEDWTWRLRQAGAELARLEREEEPAEDPAADGSQLQRMLDSEVYKRRKP